MGYTYRDAIKTAYDYLGIDENKVEKIKDTHDRGIVYEFDGIKTVIFIYPISCKQNNKQNFFDTRDSGAKERAVAWAYAQENGLRYFCFGFNEEQDRYKDYILSLESDESAISNISFRKAVDSEATGTQVNIPNDFVPNKQFERIKTPKGFFISAINKDYIGEYIKMFDNRPYMTLAVLELENMEENNVQRSAVKKYAEYLVDIEKNNKEYEEILKHNLYGIHIKKLNDALSDYNPHICIGWSDLGDLTAVASKEDLSALYDEHYQDNSKGKGQNIGQIWRFRNDVKIGDYIIFSEGSMFHIGRVETDYYYDEEVRVTQSADYVNNRKVTWLMKNLRKDMLSDSFRNTLGTAMSIWKMNDYKSAVADIIRGTYEKPDIVDEVEFIEPVYNTSIESIYERNRIVFGAPGTGKSFQLKKDCEELLDKTEGSYERVTFHSDYSYSQFVGTYKPIMDEDEKSIRYDFVPGPFMRVYVDAIKTGRTSNPQPHLLLIEEINRAKVAAVFGDVFQLLDRDDAGVSEYEIHASEDIRRYLASELGGSADKYKKIRIPNNMFIWSTMNSADQGVFLMDTAFKRRWNFEYLGINENEDEIRDKGKIILSSSNETIEWNILRKAINAKLSSSDFKINEDKLMGPFFLSKKVIASDKNGMIIDKDKFIDAFKSKVIMYLYEDAVKQGKHRFFDGCDSSKYSSVCDAFDNIGIGIFGATFRETYYESQKDEV